MTLYDDLSPPAMHIESLSPSQFGAAVSLWQDAGLARPWNDPTATGAGSTTLRSAPTGGATATTTSW
jgi:hypothetical protein